MLYFTYAMPFCFMPCYYGYYMPLLSLRKSYCFCYVGVCKEKEAGERRRCGARRACVRAREERQCGEERDEDCLQKHF